MTRVQQGPPRLQAWLNRLEVVGNRLPHPVLLFILLSIALVLLSALMTATQVSAQPVSYTHLTLPTSDLV